MEPTSDDIRALTVQVWDAVIGLPMEAGTTRPPDAALNVLGMVNITGGWEGSVLVRCARPLARSITETMLGLDVGGATSDDIADAFGEVANMIGGSVKNMMPGPSQLSLPTVVDYEHLRFPQSEERTYAAFVTHEEPMIVSVLRRADLHAARRGTS